MARAVLYSLILVFTSLHTVAYAEEYFGMFTEGPSGRFVDATPRPKFELTERFAFEDPNKFVWEVPKGTTVNGASIPQAFWSVIGGPFDGDYLKASVIHDFFCTTRSRTAHDTHRNFYYGMRANGVAEWKAKAMYWAVSTYGPDWTLEHRVEETFVCAPAGNGQASCTSTPKVTVTTVISPGLDLADPETLAVAVGKFSAVAKTLKTSEGATLDVLPTGMVDGEIGSIETNAVSVRELLTTKAYRSDPSALGIVLEPKRFELNSIESWPGGKLPNFAETLGVEKSEDGSFPVGKPMVLERGDMERFQRDLDLAPSTFDIPSKF